MEFLLLFTAIVPVIYGTKAMKPFTFDAELADLSLNSCMKDAILHIVPQCIDFGIESLGSSERVRVAVSLSVCEFESSGIPYPGTCQKNNPNYDPDLCVVDLEASPQFWTTFSGNYREIAKLCYSFAQPHAKDQIIDVLRNITKIYTRFMDLMDIFTEDSMEEFKKMMNEVKNLKDGIIDTKTEQFRVQELLNDMSDSIVEFRNDMTLAFKESQKRSEDFDDLFLQTSSQMVHLQESFLILGNCLTKKSEIIEEMSDYYQENLRRSGEQALETVENLRAKINEAHDVSKHNLDLVAQVKDPLLQNLQLSNELNDVAQKNMEMLEAQADYMSIEIPNLMAIISEKIVLEGFTGIESISSYVGEVHGNIGDGLDTLYEKFRDTELAAISSLNELEKVIELYKNAKDVLKFTILPIIKVVLVTITFVIAIIVIPLMIQATTVLVKHLFTTDAKKYRQPQDSNLRGQSPKDF